MCLRTADNKVRDGSNIAGNCQISSGTPPFLGVPRVLGSRWIRVLWRGCLLLLYGWPGVCLR